MYPNLPLPDLHIAENRQAWIQMAKSHVTTPACTSVQAEAEPGGKKRKQLDTTENFMMPSAQACCSHWFPRLLWQGRWKLQKFKLLSRSPKPAIVVNPRRLTIIHTGPGQVLIVVDPNRVATGLHKYEVWMSPDKG